MKIHNTPGFYAYYLQSRDISKKVYYHYFASWHELCSFYGDIRRCDFADLESLWKNAEFLVYQCYFTVQRYHLCDENGNQIHESIIRSEFEKYNNIKRKQRLHHYHTKRHGRKRSAWGRYYSIRTVRSRKNYYIDPDVIELQIDIKYRNKAYPPCSWDREKRQHVEKCWKRQSKRSHQWKE